MRYCHLRRLTRLLLGWARRAGMAGALALAGLTIETSAQGLDAGRNPGQLVDDALLPADTAGCWLRIRGVPDPARVDAEEVGRQRGALSELRARGYRTCVMLRPARTSWATGVRGHPYAQLPLDLREAFAWMQRLQAAYGDLVDRWEIDNEPDVGFVPENPETYAAYLKACELGAAALARPVDRRQGTVDGVAGGRWAVVGERTTVDSGRGTVSRKPSPVNRLPSSEAPRSGAQVLMAPLALPPGPWLEAFVANDGLSYTSGLNYHFYGYAEDFTDHYRLMESAVCDLTERKIQFSAKGAKGDRKNAREEEVEESAGSANSVFSVLKKWVGLGAKASTGSRPPSTVPVGYERRTLPVFLTEYGVVLDKDERNTAGGRVRQWRWFRDVGAQLRELRIEGPMAFYLPPYLEYNAKEYGLAMERVVEPRMDANEREAGTTVDGGQSTVGVEERKRGREEELERGSRGNVGGALPHAGSERAGSYFNAEDAESTEGELTEARASSQPTGDGGQGTEDGGPKTENGVSGGPGTVDREPSTVYRETRIIKGWTWERRVSATKTKSFFSAENTESTESKTGSIEPTAARGAWSLRSVREGKAEGARASSQPTAPSSPLRSGGVTFTPGDFGAEKAEPWMAGIGAQIGPWEASPALAWLLAEGDKRRKPARDWSVVVPAPSPVVIDFVAGRGLRATKSNQGYFLDSPQPAEGELRIYNFSDTAVTGTLDLGELAEAEAGPARRELTLAPGELRSLPVRLHTTVGDAQPNPWRVTFEGGAVPRSVFQTKLFALPGAGSRQVAKTLSPDEAGTGHVELLRQRSLVTGEPPETVTAGWSVTRGVSVTGGNGEWTFTITQLPAESTRPVIIELILPDDFRLPANGYLDIDYRLQPADPASDPATTPTFVAESKQLKNQVVVAWRTATGNLYGVWQPPVATTDWQRWAQRLESFTPLFYSRVKAPWRFFEQRPVALVFTLLPGELPVKLQVRRLEIVRYGDGAR